MTTITASSLRSGPSQLVAWQGNEYHYRVFAEVWHGRSLIGCVAANYGRGQTMNTINSVLAEVKTQTNWLESSQLGAWLDN